MSRLRVTPKGKVRRNIPITRVGKRQYLKRRFAHVRSVDVAGSNNHFTQKYFEGNSTAAQNFTRLGLTTDPSISRIEMKRRTKQQEKKTPKNRKRLEEVEALKELQAQKERERALQAEHGHPISEEEANTISALIRKHKTDFRAMSLDLKLNPYQLKPRQLQKQVVNYLRLERAAFPEEFKEAEEKGWLSIEAFADPKCRTAAQL